MFISPAFLQTKTFSLQITRIGINVEFLRRNHDKSRETVWNSPFILFKYTSFKEYVGSVSLGLIKRVKRVEKPHLKTCSFIFYEFYETYAKLVNPSLLCSGAAFLPFLFPSIVLVCKMHKETNISSFILRLLSISRLFGQFIHDWYATWQDYQSH